MCCTVDTKTQQRPKGRRSEEETRHIPFLVQSLLLIVKEQNASCSFSNWSQACTEKMLLPGAQDPSTGVGGRGCCWKWWEHLDSWLCWLSLLTGNQELRKGRRLCVRPGCEGLAGRQRRCGQLRQHSCPGQRSQSVLTTPTTGSWRSSQLSFSASLPMLCPVLSKT